MDVGLFLDVEDIFSAPEIGNDDSIKELASILTEEGVRANFMVIGDRAELLRQRNRSDVIRSLAPHEVGLHTRSASHPTSPEYTAGKTWEEAVAEALEHEREGQDLIQNVFGKPCVALSGHASFDTPHSQRAAAVLGLPYVYAYPAAPPLYNLSWYAGALGVPFSSPTLDSRPVHSYIGGFDDEYADSGRFADHLQLLNNLVNDCLGEGQPYLTIFLCHPQKVRLVDFIDYSWSINGVNLPKPLWGKYGKPRPRSREEVKNILVNFRSLARWIRADKRLHVMTVPELAQKYGRQPDNITRDELVEAAGFISKSQEILIGGRFSPAEVTVGLARATVQYSELGHLPPSVPRTNVLGPAQTPIRYPELKGCDSSVILALAKDIVESVKQRESLPATLGAKFERVGINHLYRALAELVLALNKNSLPSDVTFAPMPPWPEIGSALGLTFIRQLDGPLMDPNIDVNTIYRDSRLQSWTLKPALI